MHNYTVTFVYDGDFDLPDNPAERERKIPEMVIEKMEKHDFEMVDFNLTQNYEDNYAEHYIDDPYLHRSVLEIKVDLSLEDLKTREAIYEQCLLAVKQHELDLCRAYENENHKLGMLQSIICLRVKSNVKLS